MSKKVRCREEEPSNGGESQGGQSGESHKPFSFKDVVLNARSMDNEMVDEWEVEDLELQETSIRKEVSDGVPSIEFSNRVYGLIERSMSKTLVVKLLGRKIGYNALWKPKMRFQLMDIDNDYYLAKFESEMDFNNVVKKGLWVIFGHYLTVQPWSLEFSTLDAYPQSVVTWIRILDFHFLFIRGAYCWRLEA